LVTKEQYKVFPEGGTNALKARKQPVSYIKGEKAGGGGGGASLAVTNFVTWGVEEGESVPGVRRLVG